LKRINGIMSNPCLAVIVVNWRNYAITSDCLASIFASNYQPLIVIVVDNESAPDGLHDLQQCFPQAVYLPQPTNLGCGPARNFGIEKALALGADLVCFIDDDSLVGEDLFEEMARLAVRESEVGIVGAVNVFADRPNMVYVAGMRWYDWLGYGRWLWHKQAYDQLRERHGDSFVVDSVNGAGMMVKRQVIEQIGTFHLRLAPYNCEDVDFNLRARDHNFRVVVATKVRLLHRIPWEIRRGVHRMIDSIESTWYFVGVLRPFRYVPSAIIVLIARQIVYALRLVIAGERLAILQLIRSNLRGAWQMILAKTHRERVL
jgi:GT2 family glycosyltransferase